MLIDSHGLRSLHVLTILWFIDCDDCGLFFPSSLAHQSTPEQSARSLIYGRHFGVNRPMDLNALLFCAWMMSEGCSCPVVVPGSRPWDVLYNDFSYILMTTM
jgi:hypothetical protein